YGPLSAAQTRKLPGLRSAPGPASRPARASMELAGDGLLRRLVPRELLDHQAQVVRAGRRGERLAQLDHALAVDAQQALIEGLHAVVLALGDDLLDLVGLVGVHDLVEDAARRHEDLDRGHPASVSALHQPLA